MLEVVWTLSAQVDLQNVFERLEGFRDGLGEEFVLEVNRMMELVATHPHIAAAYEAPAKKLLVWKCRYGIIYVPEPRGIVVLAVAYLGQNPDFIRRKVRTLLGLD